jgi:hypothetical protein
MTVRLSPVVQTDPVRLCLESGVHPGWNAWNVHSDYFPNGRIWVRCTFKHDRGRHPDVPRARLLDNETDLHAWTSSLYYLLEAVERVGQ